MLSPASSLEVLLGKSALTALITFVICISNFAILGVMKGNMVLITLFLLVSIFFFLMLGTAIGLIAKTTASTSVVGMPILFVFLLAPMFGQFIKSDFVKSNRFSPNETSCRCNAEITSWKRIFNC